MFNTPWEHGKRTDEVDGSWKPEIIEDLYKVSITGNPLKSLTHLPWF